MPHPRQPADTVPPLISIITPCFNASSMIEDTVRSVLGQSALRTGRARLQYLVRDGASTDDTVERIEALVAESRLGDGASVRIVSEPDTSMYDALAKGLAAAEGEVVAYLNAGDYYSPTCFDAVLDVMAQTGAEWLTGMRVKYNGAGHLVDVRVPGPYRRRLLVAGFYGYRGRLGAVQQESTFWNARLNRLIDLPRLRAFHLAGDFFLWHSFSPQAELTVVSAYLGGFRLHGDHLSDDALTYRKEMSPLVERARALDWVVATGDLVALQLPLKVRRWVTSRKTLVWNEPSRKFESSGRRHTRGRRTSA